MKKKLFCAISFLLIVLYVADPLLYSGEQAVLVPEGYKFCLGPDDLVEISVWKDETLTKQVVVRPDGNISFPLIGDVRVQGRTVEEVRQEIEEKIRGYIPDAPVAVMVIRVSSPKIYVVGKVAKPGVYLVTEPLTVMQALAMAGGMTPFSDDDDILIIRKENGRQKRMQFDYSKVANGKDLEQNIYLNPGDTVVVP